MFKSGIKRNAGYISVVLAAILMMTVHTTYGADSSKAAKSSAPPREAKMDSGEWKKVLEAAKKEGKIVICGEPSEEWRKSQVNMFQQEYPEITVEFSGMAARNFWPRIRQERELGKKLWDLKASGGLDLLAVEAKKSGYLAPIRPMLLPEIADDSKWFGGLDTSFGDKEKKYAFSYILYISPTTWVNHDFIAESDLKSSTQLLNPKFRGKIVILTPTSGASQQSLAHMAFMYGENFIRELLSKQDVTLTDDKRQQTEWFVRGKYPITIGLSPAQLIPFAKQGIGRNVAWLEDKITKTSSGSGNIILLEGAPHPNAAKVYINWLLSQKTQIMLTKNVALNSNRTDVPTVNRESAIDPAKIINYRNSSKEESHEFVEHISPVIKEALKK